MRPPSVPMTVNGSPVLSASRYDRETEAFSSRKRYLRRCTGIAGHGRPLTRMTSPNMPDRPRPPLSSKMSSPELVNIASLTMSGTS